MRVLTIADGPVNEVAFAPDGTRLAVAVRGRGVYLVPLDEDGLRPLPHRPPSRAPAEAGSLTFLPGGLAWVYSGSVMWHSPAGAPRPVLPGRGQDWVGGLTCCGQGGRLVARTVDRPAFRGASPPSSCIRSWTLVPAGGWSTDWTITPDQAAVEKLAATAGGEWFFTEEYAHPGNLRFHQVVRRSARSGTPDATIRRTWGQPEVAAAAPDGGAVVQAVKSALIVWQVGSDARTVRSGTLKHFTGLAFHPSGAYLAATNTDRSGTVRLFDTTSWQVIRQYDWGLGRLECVAFSPDGTLGAAGTADGRVVLWDADD